MDMLSITMTQLIPGMRPTPYPWTVVLLIAVLAGIITGFLSSFWPARTNTRRTRDRFRARGMEFLLHDGSFRSMVETIRDLWRETLPFLADELPRTVIGIIVIGIPAVWLSGWIELHPLGQGQTTIVEATLNSGTDAQDIQLEASDGLVVETSPLRFQDSLAVNWRVSVVTPSPTQAWIELKTSANSTRMPVYVANDASAKTQTAGNPKGGHMTMRVGGSNSPVERLRISYPAASLSVGGYPVPWLAVYMVVALMLSWIVKPKTVF